jgi:hypothetical protein
VEACPPGIVSDIIGGATQRARDQRLEVLEADYETDGCFSWLERADWSARSGVRAPTGLPSFVAHGFRLHPAESVQRALLRWFLSLTHDELWKWYPLLAHRRQQVFKSMKGVPPAKRAAERETAEKFTKPLEEFHDAIRGQHYDYHEMVEIAKEVLEGRI